MRQMMGVSIEHILGPVGATALLVVTVRVLYVWLRETISKRITALEAVISVLKEELTAVKTELSHCQGQHNITTQELLKLSNENGYLRGRLEAMDKTRGKDAD